MNIYVGNLSYDVTQDDLKQAFEAFGAVKSATIIRDKFSGESRGFGFVEIEDKAAAEAAIQSLNGSELMGKKISVSEARPRRENRRERGGRPGGGGGRRF
jgi:RNA recognition motif-containing protein